MIEPYLRYFLRSLLRLNRMQAQADETMKRFVSGHGSTHSWPQRFEVARAVVEEAAAGDGPPR